MSSHHIGAVTEANRAFQRPWHAQCSCGTAGDFKSKGEAEAYLTTHFARLGGISSSELTYPVTPAARIPSGATPGVLEQGKPEPPPPPPAPKVG